MTVVYIDLLFLLNLTANYLLLLVTGQIAGARLRRGRIALSAALGALYACLIFVPGGAWLAAVPCKLASGAGMALLAYGRERRLLFITLVYFACAAALGGLVMACETLWGGSLTLEHGVLYSWVDLRLLLLLIAAGYAALTLVFRRTGRHGGGELVKAEVTLWGEKVTLTALLDSGNTLTDPISNAPVLVAEAERFRQVLPPDLDPGDPAEGAKKLARDGKRGARLLPYRAVGVPCGMLLAAPADRVVLDGREQEKMLVAFSPTPVSDGGGYQALLGGSQ